MGLKTRLLTAFLTIILLPILTFIGVISYFSYGIDEVSKRQQMETEKLLSSINDVVIDNYDLLKMPNEFNDQIEPLIENYNIELIVSTKDNEELFNSEKIHETDSNSLMFTLRESQVQAINGEVYNIEIKSDSIEILSGQTHQKIISSIIIAIGSSLFVLIILIIIWTIYISRTILNPIKQIYRATEEMTNGNLDYTINYKKRDEIGRFIKGFNFMRHHLKESMSKQEQYEKNRKELIASISHDLRTPLQSIKGYVEGINDGIVDNEEMKKKYLQVILSKTEQLDRLIEDLFEFSKIELNQLVINENFINSKDFFSDVLEEKKFDLHQKTIQLNIEKEIPSVVLIIDPQRIEQVITNVIDNAVQYGATKINLLIETNREQGFLTIKIQDDGQGISEEDMEKIFNRFYRGEKSRSREHGGTGLGLSIAKSIIEAHDGQISVESKLNIGSIFTITLPYIEDNKNNDH